MIAPSILLIRPQLGENIGAAARVMANFGLSDLRLVAPKNGWPNERADAMAVGAVHILQNAALCDTPEEAAKGLNALYATTARERDLVKPVFTPKGAAADMQARIAAGQRVGILFGPERTGLTNDDISITDAFVHIPVSPEHSSLNLAQAVAIHAYEYFQQVKQPEAMVLDYGRTTPAKREDLLGLFGHLEDELDEVNFYHDADKRPSMVQNIRAALTRAQLTEQEVRTFRGIIRELVGKRQQHGKKTTS